MPRQFLKPLFRNEIATKMSPRWEVVMEHIPSDAILQPRSFTTFTYSRLISLLSENETWKRVAQSFGIFSNSDIDKISRRREPAEALILELGARLCSIGFFCDILKECKLYNILTLLNPCDPVIIVEQPFSDDKGQMVVRGSHLRLTCSVTGLLLPKYQWYCKNEKLPTQKDSLLDIKNFGPENEGEYFCLVSQDGCDNVRISNSVNVVLAPEEPEVPEPPEADSSDESVVTLSTSSGPKPSAKIALLIANQLYDNLHCLQTPENDVRTLVEIFRGFGFHTIALQNLNLTEMRNIVYYFSDILPKNAYVIFYFSGHGFEIYDKFMLPVNAPGPEDFLQTHAFSERELLRAVLNSQPMVFLELLDMCLKPPDPSNKKIFNEKVSLYEYSASHNLIQGYATTSYSGAYEKITEENGLYVKHLKEYFLKKKDMPIVEILRNVAKDIAKVCPIQKPFFGTNVTMDYRLTDRSSDNPEIGEKIKALSVIPPDFILPFKQVGINSRVSLTPFLGVFFNTLQVQFSNLQDFKVGCIVPGDELSLELSRVNGDAFIKIMNIQRLISNKTLTLRLFQKNGMCLDSAAWVFNKPVIASVALQDEVSPGTQAKNREN